MSDEIPPVRSAPVAASIGPIPTLPVFFKLKDRIVLLAGGALPAVWKAELLAATGAKVVVCDPAPCPEMIALAGPVTGALDLRRRRWDGGDFADVALAIGALEGNEADDFRRAAHAAGVPVNIVDIPALCDFQFGTIIARSPLLIAISTDGAAPVFGQALRARIEALLPATLGAWAVAAQLWRAGLQDLKLGFAARRRFWESFTDRALAGNGRLPDEADRIACLSGALAAEATPSYAVDLVGAGPGPADLVTLKAVRALQSADVILYEGAVDPAVLGLARREARRIEEPNPHGLAANIIAGLIAGGKRVALVAPGTPERCGRWMQRRSALSAIGLSYHMIGGLTCDACPDGCARKVCGQ